MVVALYFHRLQSSGGAERMLCKLANSLVDNGFDVHIISWDQPNIKPYYELHERIKWFRTAIEPGAWNKVNRFRRLKNYLTHNRVKILVGFVMSGDKVVYSAALASRVKLVVAERNSPAMYYYRYNYFFRVQCFLLMHFADYITVQFKRYKNSYPNTLAKKIVSIPNSVELSKKIAQPHKPDNNGRYKLLAVSRFDNFQKKLDCLIHAFFLIHKEYPNWDLVIVGGGPDKDILLESITSFNLGDRVLILNETLHLSTIYSEANLFVIPSLWEGFPNALAEALSYGVPAVGFSMADGVSDLIKDGKSGWLTKGDFSSSSLADALSLAMSDSDELQRRGEYARDSVKSFTHENMIRRWVDLLNVVEGKG